MPLLENLHCKAKSFNNYSFTANDGLALKDHDSPKYGNSHENVNKGTSMLMHFVINFNIMPACCCAQITL